MGKKKKRIIQSAHSSSTNAELYETHCKALRIKVLAEILYWHL